MTDAPEDRELDQHLAGGSRLSREYAALGREEPPPALDARIRAAAAAAVPVAPRRRRAPLWWLRPAALAASVVLALSLMLRLGEQSPSIATMPVHDGPAAVIVDLRSPRTAAEAPALELAQPDLVEPAPVAAAPPAPVQSDGFPGTPEPPRAARPLAPAQGGGPRVTAERMESAKQERTVPAAVTATTMKPAAPPDALARAIDAIRTRVAAPSAGSGALVAAAREAAPATPEDRLREILALHDAGRPDEAAAALAEFARDFPDDPVAALAAAP